MKKYTLEFTEEEDGTINVNSKNDGFSSLELLGLLTLSVGDNIKQIHNKLENKDNLKI